MRKKNQNKLTQKQQENRQEDKKAFKKFAWLMVLGFFFGIVCGGGGTLLGAIMEEGSTREFVLQFAEKAAIYGGFLYTTILSVISIVLYTRSRKEYTGWDEENEEVLCRIETMQSYVIWFSNLILFGSYFFFSVGVWAVDIGKIKPAIAEQDTGYWISLGIVFLHMAYALIAACLIQQKAVNLSKEINPEKSGSIYDMKFQDKWLESCDEAERYTVYKCSFKTFKTMQMVGMILWVICLIGQLSFHTGAFATIIVTIFLIIQTSVYSVQGIYFAKHPSEVMK